MAEAVVSLVVERIGEFITQKGKLSSGVSGQIEVALSELKFMRGFLKDADARLREEESVRVFVYEVRDAAYDLEDAIEIYALKVDSNRKKQALKRYAFSLIEGFNLHKIGSEIGRIRNQLSYLRSRFQSYNFREIIRESGGASWEQRQRPSYSHVMGRDIVGLADSVEHLAMVLVNGESCQRVVSICGMGGVGKTTLADQVYHHHNVRRHFDCFAWVCASLEPKTNVGEQILVQLISATDGQRREIAKMKDDEIAKRLYRIQRGKRCLVVLDDIWTIRFWESLEAAFPFEETESKVLLTTRNAAIAQRADRNGFCLILEPLNEDNSWELFDKMAIVGRDDRDSEIYPKMQELGKKMLHYCAGLPLLIILLAGLLARKETVDEWDVLHKNLYVYLKRGEEEYLSISWLLSLSYDDLPYPLKSCFLYLGLFPEDFEIPVKRLTQLWIAEGLIPLAQQRKGLGETLEDVAYSYLSELVERCLVQVGEVGSTRKIKTCRIHDLMRDLCLYKAEQEVFFLIDTYFHRNERMDLDRSSMGKPRRLALYLGENADNVTMSRYERYSCLRSLLYFAPRGWLPGSENFIESMFKNFKLLRVLKMEGLAGVTKLPYEIGNMVHLRFLSLRDSSIIKFPSSIGNLIFLQTLDLRTHDLGIVPNVIWKMKELRHLYLPNIYVVHGKLRLSSVHNLQTLMHVSSHDCDFSDLSELTNLRKMAIKVSSPLEDLDRILKSTSRTLERIRSLFVENLVGFDSCEEVTKIVLSCCHVYKLTVRGPTVMLLKGFQYYPNLTKLSLFQTLLEDDQMSILEQLPNLRILYLEHDAFNTNKLICSEGGFPQLEFLSLIGMLRIEEWKMEKGGMPSLCHLRIANCGRLMTVPDGLQFITTLRDLTITDMPETFHSRLQEGGEDYHKIRHVPFLVFGILDEGFYLQEQLMN